MHWTSHRRLHSCYVSMKIRTCSSRFFKISRLHQISLASFRLQHHFSISRFIQDCILWSKVLPYNKYQRKIFPLFILHTQRTFWSRKIPTYYWFISSQIWKVKVFGLTWFHFYVNIINAGERFLWITSSKHHITLKGLFTNVVLFKVECNICMLQIQYMHEKTRKKTRWNSVQMPLIHAYMTTWQTSNCKDSSSIVYVS